MTARDLLVDVFLTLGVGCELVCCVGVVAMRSVFDRLHYAAASTTLGAFFIGAAVMIRESVSAAGLETIATVALLFLLYPVLEIALARAGRRVEYGHIEALDEELAE